MRVSSIKFRRCISMLFLALLLAIPIFFSQRTNVYAKDEGQKAEISLDADMKTFKTFTVNGNTYRMAQMSGKFLKDTLGCSKVDVKSQYLCWVNVDKKISPSATIGWYTKKTYIHKKPVSNYNVTGVAAGNSNHIVTMDTSSDKVADNINGKVTIDPYVNKVGIVCPAGETATMFYVSSDMIQDKVDEKYTVRGTQHYLIYTSPMTDAVTYDENRNRHVQNLDWLTLAAWASGAGYGQSGITWSSTASFASHYNVPIELESHDLRAQVMYRNELDIYDPDSDIGEKEQAKILRVDSKTGKDSSKLSKALKGDWIGRGGSAEIKGNHDKIDPKITIKLFVVKEAALIRNNFIEKSIEM